jgi:hypothetical protein
LESFFLEAMIHSDRDAAAASAAAAAAVTQQHWQAAKEVVPPVGLGSAAGFSLEGPTILCRGSDATAEVQWRQHIMCH